MNLRAKKSFGQNFLNSPQAVSTMITSARVQAGDTIIEVGPGKGVLTKALLKTGARVIAFEIDPRMIEYLSMVFASEITTGQLQIITGDILEHTLEEIVLKKPYKVVANIPYYITNALLRYFLSNQQQPRCTCFLVQHEVAERIARGNKESILSLSVKAYGNPSYVRKVPRRYFTPIPKVDSAILCIDEISRSVFDDMNHELNFFRLVKKAFAHRRKQLIKNITTPLENKEFWEKKLRCQGHDGQVRAEDIPLENWIELSRL